jgi:polyribonucleotide nucleotidyltransferase
MMFDVHKREVVWGGRKLTLETGRIARQADGAVLATYGETAVLCTVVGAKSVKPGQDFFPLTVHYQEKFFAAGKIPGGFFKREGRPTEKEVLTSRLIDRPIRPLFPEGFYNEILVICQTLSYDGENDADIVAMIGASAALTLSGVPFMGPIGAARVGYHEGAYVLNPTRSQMETSQLDLVVAGTSDAVLMVESEAQELTEDVMLNAVMFGQASAKIVIDAIISLAESAAKEPWAIEALADYKELEASMRGLVEADLRSAYAIISKSERRDLIAAAKTKAMEAFGAEHGEQTVGKLLKKLEQDIVRTAILRDGQRIDGRDTKTVRPIDVQVQILPRTHGSALFTRGETQALVTTTLGTGDDEQMIDSLDGITHENFMLHYNFPPYSVGEVGRFGGAQGRREVGHGKLAWRAVHPVLPTKAEFPYTIRVVSDITESNGSSSMASVCGASLAMMDAGVPLKRPVSGIAMGLILEGDKFAILSDILGDEDHLGDMDFKVAGTEVGITALQMDIKVAGITQEIMQQALTQAHAGRAHILAEMARGLSGVRLEMSQHAPRIETIKIPKDKIREVIGTGGKVIREIVEVTGAKVDIEDDGTVKVSSANLDSIKAALKWIDGIVAEPEVGKVYDGKVVSVVDFGAFVNFLGARDGLVHVSEIKAERVAKVSDVLSEGALVKVKVLGIDDRGKVRLSMRLVNQETGELLEDTRPPKEDRGPREERGGREERAPRADGDGEGRGGDDGDRSRRRRPRPRRDD